MNFYLICFIFEISLLNFYYTDGTSQSESFVPIRWFGIKAKPLIAKVTTAVKKKNRPEKTDDQGPLQSTGGPCGSPCLNGGNCLAFGVCQCPQEFKGSHCQYGANACTARKLQFNGVFNCSESGDAFSCSVSCPEGMHFEFPPASLYSCSYANGKFLPEPVPQCMFGQYSPPLEADGEFVFEDMNPATQLPIINNTTKVFEIIENKKPHAGSCFTWGGSHFKTFDGVVFSFTSLCAHTLVRDVVDNTFSVVIQNSQECKNLPEDCYTLIRIYLQDKEYVLKRSDQGMPIFVAGNRILPIPGHVPGIRAEMSAHYVVILIDSIGVKIKWDGMQLVQVEAREGLWNKTSGLCGKIDGDPNNDVLNKDDTVPKSIVTLALSWQVDTFGDACKAITTETNSCENTKIKGSKGQKGLEFCKKLLSDKRFVPCHTVVDVRILKDACLWDYCSCKYPDPKECACETLNVYVRECAHKGVTSLAKWRDDKICPIQCTGGRVYMSCAPIGGQAICGGAAEKLDEDVECEEGCYCPEGTFLYNSECVTKENCPCMYRGKDYPPGSSVPKDCNTCTCSDGSWICTQITCPTRCSVIGDPHYITFDGRRFDFMGLCSYYLIQHDNFTIEVENIACGGQSCPKAMIVKIAGQTIKVKQGREVTVNGQEVPKIPFDVAGVTIRTASSMFLVVELSNGVEVLWDGVTRVHVDVPPSFIGQTKGLCGTFNKNQKDDFLTPEGDIEQSPIAFANKWKTTEKCGDVSDKLNSHPCDINIHNKAAAEEHCKVIRSPLFADCHSDVDPESFYQDCIFDTCSCDTQLPKCLCPMIAAYAEECARKGVRIEWRNIVRGCGIQCSSGQTYQICGNSCTRSCYDIATRPDCRRQCVEGCNCPEGETLDEDGECIPIGQCGCHHDGLDFPAGYKEVRLIHNTSELCTCANAQWSCRSATDQEIIEYPKASDLKTVCDSNENQEFTTCEPAEPITCKNMHSPELVSTAFCRPGCQCKPGYVLDGTSKTCVRPTECPCHHGGQSYNENSTVRSDCNTCKCKYGKWQCTDWSCPGECSAWGDSHYKTFDGKLYDYQGQCDYILAKGIIMNEYNFDISVQNVPCGSLGVSCSKSLTIKIGTIPQQESITLTQEKEIPEHQTLKQLIVRQKSHFVIVEAPELGFIVRWDKGTRVYVKLDTRWKNKVKGLCGNYNDNELDDFQTPSGGIVEVSAQLFGDSWRLQPYCPEAVDITDTCNQRPDRKVWALKKCGILKSSVFASCHSEVPVENYLDRCIFDTCACDQGGDCECLCTALAAYAQECNNEGIPIRWRTPDLCPMQCDERCAHYSPCISTCPVETCDNTMVRGQLSKLCKQDTCIEGCEVKPCPADFIYTNSSMLECVPRKVCKPLCLEINGVEYFEGDLIEEDACHTCYCSRGKENCQGQPCVTGLTVMPSLEEVVACASGWTEWINQNQFLGVETEKEQLPGPSIMNNLNGISRCNIKDIVGIECRTVNTHLSAEETGLDARCSLEQGLICTSNQQNGSCPDFEIRVHCKCGLIQECGPDEELQECAVECNNLCMYYSHLVKLNGHCLHEQTCEKGCVSALKERSCSQGMLWASNETCVAKHDCMCISHDGTPVRPGVIFEESECEICQCVDNYYTCDDSACFEEYRTAPRVEITVTPPSIVEEENVIKVTPITYFKEETGAVFVVPSTVTPPGQCNEDDFIQLIEGDIPLADEAFTASSTSSREFAPKYARLSSHVTGESGGSWRPKYSNQKQYLQVDLARQEPIYGVIIKGNPSRDEYVTRYNVLYTSDGHTYSYVMDSKKQPKLFRGSFDGNTPVKQLFDIPVEARIIRIKPDTWHKDISLRVELIGCEKLTTTTISSTVSTLAPYCTDPMGVDDGMMADQQISVSSELMPEHGKNELKMSRPSGWQPITNSPSEWVQFDFLEPRNISGITTQGGSNGWVTAFNAKYSHNGQDWNPMLNDEGTEQTFPGNVDSETPHDVNFDLPVQTKLLKIIPVKWHKNIQMRIEPHGCFSPYPLMEVSTTTEVSAWVCNDCPGVSAFELELAACRCKEGLWWDGEGCVARSQCPCMVGHMSYVVGAVFEKEDCSQCRCKLGGVSQCTPKVCDKCEKGLRSVITSTCGCICQPCDEGTRFCPTSNICINDADWCNGVKNCPDDETDCEVTSTTTSTAVVTTTTMECPIPSCSPGYKVVVKHHPKTEQKANLHTMFSTKTRKGGRKTTFKEKVTKGGVKGGSKRVKPLKYQVMQEQVECVEFECVVIKKGPSLHRPCPETICPPGYVREELDFGDRKEVDICDKYECIPAPPSDAVCNVTGRTFSTFDLTEYKYDICNHIVARDLEDEQWEILLKKNCTEICSRSLIIHHENHVFVLYPDLTIEYDGYKYTVEHTKKIGSQFQFFEITRLGEALIFVSNVYGFWVIWDNQENARIGVARKLLGKVDGLCGYFNDYSKDDKLKLDGSLAKTTVEFGDSWKEEDESVVCEIKTCPLHIQNKAWDMCKLVKEQTFAPCAKVLDVDAFISRCVETTCTCLEAAVDKEGERKCRCMALQSFVVDCLTADSNLEVVDWRMKHDCPVACDAPLVHHDCYRRRCEPSCGALGDLNTCPKLSHVCFPGCYCPPGYVRKGENCILPTSCGDCECNVLPHLEYVTYDERNFTINGKCVFVMSRDVLDRTSKDHKFQVLITNEQCKNKKHKMCVGKITILYKDNKIHVIQDANHNKLKLIVNYEAVSDFKELEEWTHVKQDPAKHLRILLDEIQVLVSVYYPSLGVSIKAPSLKYGGKLEGLCGNCNGNNDDDLKTVKGAITADINEFGASWLYDLPGGQHKEQCSNLPEEKCAAVPVDSDPCTHLEDSSIYGQCHPVLNPSMFIDWCKKDICNGHLDLSCGAIEAYSQECGHLGFCMDWRTRLCSAKKCPGGQEYKSCAPSCSQTCEAVKDKGKKCYNSPVEGCFCPEGKLFLNGTCVMEDRCEACDDEGHRSGDTWQKDACTNCTCEGTNVQCETRNCPSVETICEQGFTVQQVATLNECCDKYICVQTPLVIKATCKPPQQLQCAAGQLLKLIKDKDGCQKFVCECKPIEECDSIDVSTIAPPEPGIIQDIDRSGCCPIVVETCKVERCPKALTCPQFHLLEKAIINGKCCPQYNCAGPKNKCIVDLEYTASETGGERLRNEGEKQQVLKEGTEKWQDGPCRDCKCIISSSGNYHDVCTITECSKLAESNDQQDYVLELESIVGQCCADIKKVACKHNQKIYNVGEKWSVEGDYCTTIECTRNSLGIQKVTQIASCDTKCELGWEYSPPTIDSKQCCGSCKPIACVAEGHVYKIGEEWTSIDHCTNYLCSSINGSVQIQSIVVNCPELPEDVMNDYVVEIAEVEAECCKSQTIVACKVGTKIYKIGETWPSSDGDKCKKITCVENAIGEIIKQESIETCNTNCSKGWEYQKLDSQCCGECVQVACVVDNGLKSPGENWTSTDGCATNFCDLFGDLFTVVTQQESCPNINNCLPENIYTIGCCKHCNMTSEAQVTCGKEEMKPLTTVGLISITQHPHGKCVNKKPLKGFTECTGYCKSFTSFDPRTGKHESVCSCCQVRKYEPFIVELECEDGHSFKEQIHIPSKCGCEQCVSEKLAKQYSKGGPKAKVKRGMWFD